MASWQAEAGVHGVGTSIRRAGVRSGEITSTEKKVFGGALVTFRLVFGVGWGNAPSVQARGEPRHEKVRLVSEKFIAAVGHADTVTVWLTDDVLQALAETVVMAEVGEEMAGAPELLPTALPKALT